MSAKIVALMLLSFASVSFCRGGHEIKIAKESLIHRFEQPDLMMWGLEDLGIIEYLANIDFYGKKPSEEADMAFVKCWEVICKKMEQKVGEVEFGQVKDEKRRSTFTSFRNAKPDLLNMLRQEILKVRKQKKMQEEVGK